MRSAPQHERISVDPAVMGGKPCIKGTRIPVNLLVEKLGEGMSIDELLEAYPGLTTEDVRAAAGYAAPSRQAGG